MRAVLDPGVLVSAVLSGAGAPFVLVWACLEGRYELICSPHLLDELEDVLSRAKFRQRLNHADVLAYVTLLRRHAILVEDPPVPRPLTPDPDDDYLVALALAAHADVLVSGDPHLTRLAVQAPPVLTPRSFLDMVAAADGE